MKVSTRTTVKLTAKEKQAGLTTLKKMRALFRDGKSWLQHAEEKINPKTGFADYCLIGALHEADGAGEHIVQMALGRVITDKSKGAILLLAPEEIYNYEVRDGSEMDDALEARITGYNDNKARRFADILNVLAHAEALIESGVFIFDN